ncbi:hypothetical protein Tco_0132149 [Tanacetum coccineum]
MRWVIYANEKVVDAFVAHYEVFLGQPGSVSSICTFNLFQNRLDLAAALDMIRDVSDQEIKYAMFSMGNDKSPGPDGFTAAFFKEAWDIVSKDVMAAVLAKYIANRIKEFKAALDDLFLFAHGDANSARVIMDALDEFKQVSGLTPSRLPVKYLGVPLVSSRLIYRDCKELIEKVQARVDNWKNNTSTQLVFVEPWEFEERASKGGMGCCFCLPKSEGGLGIRSLAPDSLLGLEAPRAWDNVDLSTMSCSLCNLQADSHEHLFFKCDFSKQVWSKVKVFAGLPNSSPSIDSILLDIAPFAKRKSSRSIIAKLVVAASFLFHWQNVTSMFKKSKRSQIQVVDCFLNAVSTSN